MELVARRNFGYENYKLDLKKTSSGEIPSFVYLRLLNIVVQLQPQNKAVAGEDHFIHFLFLVPFP